MAQNEQTSAMAISRGVHGAGVRGGENARLRASGQQSDRVIDWASSSVRAAGNLSRRDNDLTAADRHASTPVATATVSVSIAPPTACPTVDTAGPATKQSLIA